MTDTEAWSFLDRFQREPKTSNSWLERKRKTDDIPSHLWRVHNCLYDFKGFDHPGGINWLAHTQGQDITEAFEVHHLNIHLARETLKKYKVKEITTPRSSSYTFEEDGFYCTLRQRVFLLWKNKIKKEHKTNFSFYLADFCLISFLCLCTLSGIYQSFVFAAITGLVLTFVMGTGHNFFHQKDKGNFRRFYWDFCCMHSEDWRVTHALSHHLYTNTVIDAEVWGLEPFLWFLPKIKGSDLQLKLQPFYFQFLVPILVPVQLLQKTIGQFLELKRHLVSTDNQPENTNIDASKDKNPEYFGPFHFSDSFVFLELIWLQWLSGSFSLGFQLWLIVHMSCSFFFLNLSLVAGTHHADVLWHQGDSYTSLDFGEMQIMATVDRHEILDNRCLTTFYFGDHVCHHLFPTIDHSYLPFLYPVLKQTCQEFGIPLSLRAISMKEATLGFYRQIARTETR